MSDQRQVTGFDINHLLHPACAFRRPADVVNALNLTVNEKRAILASWASDACAVEAAPELRLPSDGPVVRFDEVMDALKSLDGPEKQPNRYEKLVTRAQRVRDLYDKNGGGIFAS
jgi:hypothetical protein